MSWKTVSLGSVCKVIAGQSPEGKYYNKDGVGIPFYQGKKDFGEIYINPPSVWTSEITKEATKDDILMSVRAPVGPVNIATENICIGRGLAAIRATENIDKSYLFNFLLSIEKDLVGSSGAVFNSINKGQIEKLQISLPPLPIQKKIVLKLDSIFTEIDKATVAAKTNVKNAEALYQNFLTNVFEKGSKNWDIKKISDIADLIDSLHKTPKYTDDGFPMVRVTDVKAGELKLQNTKKVDEETFNEFSKRHTPKIGDIVFSRVGSYGVSAIVSTNEKFCLGQNTVFIVPKINSIFLYYFLNSGYAKKQYDELKDGVTQPTISLKSIKSVTIPLPDEKIIAKLIIEFEKIFKQTNLLKQKYINKLKHLESLKQSALQKAFAGELIKD